MLMGQLWGQVKRSWVLKDDSRGSALTHTTPHPCQNSCTALLGLAQSGLSTWHWPQGLTLPLSCLAFLWIPCSQYTPFSVINSHSAWLPLSLGGLPHHHVCFRAA